MAANLLNQVKGYTDFNKEYDMSKAMYLGGGAFGKVYKIQSNVDHKFWAVKIVECPKFSQFQFAQNEFRLSKQIDQHENIISVKEYYEWHKSPTYYVVLVLELGDDSMQSVVDKRRGRRQNFTDDELNKIFKQCLEALYYMQKQKGIYHRDIKPENLLYFSEAKSVKLTDFGLSKTFQEEKLRRTVGGNHSILGTPIYLSPILWDAYIKKNNYKAAHSLEKSDVFSLGITFMQIALLLNVQQLSGCNQENGPKTILKHTGNIKNVSIKKMVASMLEFDQKKRPGYQSLLQEHYSESNPQPTPMINKKPTGQYQCAVHKADAIQICLEEGCYEFLCVDCVKTHNGTHTSLMLCSMIQSRIINQNKTLGSIQFLKNQLDLQLPKKVDKNQNLSENTLKEAMGQIKKEVSQYLDKILNSYLDKQKKSTSDLKSRINKCSLQLQNEYDSLNKLNKQFKDSRNKQQVVLDILKTENNISGQSLKKIQGEFDEISEKCQSNQELKSFAKNKQEQVNKITSQFKYDIDQIMRQIQDRSNAPSQENLQFNTDLLPKNNDMYINLDFKKLDQNLKKADRYQDNNNNQNQKQDQVNTNQYIKINYDAPNRNPSPNAADKKAIPTKEINLENNNNKKPPVYTYNLGKLEDKYKVPEEKQNEKANGAPGVPQEIKKVQEHVKFKTEVKNSNRLQILSSQDDYMISTTYTGKIDIKKKEQTTKTLEIISSVYSVLIMQEMKCLIIGSGDFSVKVYNMENMEQKTQFTDHSKQVTILTKLKSNQFASGGYDTGICIYEQVQNIPFSFQIKKKINEHSSLITGIITLPNHNALVSTSYDRSIGVHSLSQEKTNIQHDAHKHLIGKMSKLKENHFVTSDMRGNIKVWSVEANSQDTINQQRQQQQLAQQNKQVGILQIKQSKHTFESVKLVEVYQLVQYHKNQEVMHLGFHSNSLTFISADKSGIIKFTNYVTGEQLYMLDLNKDNYLKPEIEHLTVNMNNEIFISKQGLIQIYTIQSSLNEKYLAQVQNNNVSRFSDNNQQQQTSNLKKKKKSCVCY